MCSSGFKSIVATGISNYYKLYSSDMNGVKRQSCWYSKIIEKKYGQNVWVTPDPTIKCLMFKYIEKSST